MLLSTNSTWKKCTI